MWSIEDPGMIPGPADTSLMGPSIWTQGNPPQQWPAGPGAGWQQPIPPPHSYTGFPPSQPPLPKNPWDRPAPATGGWGAPPQVPAPQAPSGGWNAPAQPPAPSQNWGIPPPTAPQQQWGGAPQGNVGGGGGGGGGGGHSYSEIARKNAPLTAPPVRNTRPYEGWGQTGQPRVDQGTPWDGARGPQQPPQNEMMNKGGGDQWRQDGTGHWGDPTGGSTAQVQQPTPTQSNASWGAPPPPPAAAPTTNGWGNGPPPAATAPPPPSDTSGWGQPSARPAEGWGQPEVPTPTHDSGSSRGGPSNQWHTEASNPQHPTMWVPPAAQGNPPPPQSWNGMSSGAGPSFNNSAFENRDDMVWHDPNPKTKKVMMDKGTGVWGDPGSQGAQEIKRWRNVTPEEAALASQLALSTSSNNTPVSTPAEPAAADGGAPAGLWDSTPAHGASTTPASGKASTPGWGDSTPVTTSATSTGWGNPTTTASADATGWNTQPTNAVNKQPEPNPPTEAPPNTFQQNGSSVNASGGGMPMNMPAALLGLTSANTANNPDLQRLTQQIADHLRVAVTKGLININILNQPLPQQTLLLLNQLLQRIPKLEAATNELANLRRHTANANANASQTQEMNRLVTEIGALQVQVRNYQNQINQQTGGPAKPATSGSNTPGDTPSQSKLMTAWKNAANASGDGDKGVDGLGDAIGLGTNGDPWANAKLNAGAVDWSAAAQRIYAGDGNSVKSGEGSDGNKANDDGLVRGLLAPGDRNSITPNADEDSSSNSGRQFKEFVPGEKFEWQDPNDVAKDPNATPGSLKPNSLSVGSNMDRASAGIAFPVTFPHRPSHITGAVTPTKMAFEPRSATGFSPSSDWRGRPPSSMGQPMGQAPGRGNYRSMSSPGQNSAFAPYPANAMNNMWILMQNVQDENSVRGVLRRMGASHIPLIVPPGSSFALLKCEMGADKLLPRLHQELMPLNISVSLPSPQELERLTIMSSNRMPPFMPPGPGPMWPSGGNESGGGWGAPPQSEYMGGPPPGSGWGDMNGDMNGPY